MRIFINIYTYIYIYIYIYIYTYIIIYNIQAWNKYIINNAGAKVILKVSNSIKNRHSLNNTLMRLFFKFNY